MSLDQELPESSEYATLVGKNTVPDGATISPPNGTAAPIYPYNKVTEYEGGHFKEYDSTPGNERIQERHKTGTGYEYMSDGGKREHVVGDRYSVIMGSDYLIVRGQVQIIVEGDAGIKVKGHANVNVDHDLNLLVGGNMTQVIDGDYTLKVMGGYNQVVEGDKAMSVSGFYTIGINGDMSLDSASVNMVARRTEMNLASYGDMNVMAVGNYGQLVSGNSSSQTQGSSTITSAGAMNVSSESDVAVGGKGQATFHGKGGTTINSDAGINVKGSSIYVDPPVDRAKYAQKSSRAAILAGVSPEPNQAEGGDGGTESQSAKGKEASLRDATAPVIDRGGFQPITGTQTQSRMKGATEVAGYTGGFMGESRNG